MTLIEATTNDQNTGDDAVATINPSVSQSGYHSAQSVKTLQPKVCDVTSIKAEAKRQGTNYDKVTVGVQCDAIQSVILQPSYVETSASSQCI